jgi:hypothetical protein
LALRGSTEIESAPGLAGTRAGAQETVAAMRAGAEVIYQGVLFDGVRWRGHSDFLHLPRSSRDFSHDVQPGADRVSGNGRTRELAP